MKTLKQVLGEVSQPKGGDEKRFKSQHIIQKIPHPVALETQFKGDIPKQKRLGDYDEGEDLDNYDQAYEESVNESYAEEMSMRHCHFIKYAAEEIIEYIQSGNELEPWFNSKLSGTYEKIKGLHAFVEGDKHMMDNESDFGDFFESTDLCEKFSPGELALDNGSVKISKQDAALLNKMFNDLNDKNKKEFMSVLTKDEAGYKEILGFAREAL